MWFLTRNQLPSSDTYTSLVFVLVCAKSQRTLTSLQPHVWGFPPADEIGGGHCACGLWVSSLVAVSCLSWCPVGKPKPKGQTQNLKGKRQDPLGFGIRFPIGIGVAPVYV